MIKRAKWPRKRSPRSPGRTAPPRPLPQRAVDPARIRNEGGAIAALLGRTIPLRVRLTSQDVARLLAQPEILDDPARLSAVAINGGLLMLEHAAQKFAERVLLRDAAYDTLERWRYCDLLYKLRGSAPTTADQRTAGVLPGPPPPPSPAGAAAGGPLPPPEAVPTRGPVQLEADALCVPPAPTAASKDVRYRARQKARLTPEELDESREKNKARCKQRRLLKKVAKAAADHLAAGM